MYKSSEAKRATDLASRKIQSEQENLYADYIKAVELSIQDAAALGLYTVTLNTVGQTVDAVAFMVGYLQRAGYVIYNQTTTPVINWE